MNKYKEIFKLKNMLEKANIPFTFYDDWIFADKEHYQICCPNREERYISVIEGFGTYGAEEDLLEIMGLLTDKERQNDVVLGYLTAEDVYKRIEKHLTNKEA